MLYQKILSSEKNEISNFFIKDKRSEDDFKYVLNLIKKNDIINECYKKAEYFINLASNSLSVFEETEEKNILKNLTSFSIRRNF